MVQRSLPMWRNTRWRSWLEWRERSYSYGSPYLRSPLIIHPMVIFISRDLMELGNPSLSVPLKLRRMSRSKIWVLQGYDDLGYLFLLCNNVKLIEGLRSIIFTSWEYFPVIRDLGHAMNASELVLRRVSWFRHMSRYLKYLSLAFKVKFCRRIPRMIKVVWILINILNGILTYNEILYILIYDQFLGLIVWGLFSISSKT